MITILRTDENGRTEAELSDYSLVEEILALDAATHGRCLPFIDPYGDTTFNQLQLPILVQELRTMTSVAPPELKERIGALIEFVESAAATVHTYVKFIGD